MSGRDERACRTCEERGQVTANCRRCDGTGLVRVLRIKFGRAA